VVFGINDDTSTNDGVPVDYLYSGYYLSNSSDEIVLNNGTIDIDQVIWDGKWGVTSGYTLQLDAGSLDATLNDDLVNWCLATVAYGVDNYGTPGDANDACVVAPVVPIEWCNVQHLSSVTTDPSVAVDTYGQVYSSGVTDSAGQGAGIDAEVGYGLTGTDPSADPSAWTWATAAYNVDDGNNDEYMFALSITDPGNYGVAYRFSGDSGASWTYCDNGGSSDSDLYDTADEYLLTVGTDGDGDGYFDVADGGDDCDDSDSAINPDAVDDTVDGVDQNCDGVDGLSSVLGIGDLSVGDLIITEFIANPAVVSDGDGEWFEVANLTGSDVDLEGLVIYDLGSDSFTVTGSLVVLANTGVVFGTNADTSTNDNAPVDYEYASGMYLSNSGDEIVLNNGVEDIDSVIWDGTWGVSSGYSLELSLLAIDATLNDDAANWCLAVSAYGADNYGTPNALNDCSI
jgi:hypothetical protein